VSFQRAKRYRMFDRWVTPRCINANGCAWSLQFQDFKSYATTASLKDNTKLERSVALFNGLSQWIQCMVLSKTTPMLRAAVIVKFVDVAKVY